MAVKLPDKIFLGAALLLVLGSAGWFAREALRVRRGATAPAVRVKLDAAPFAPVGADAPVVKTETWEAPAAQTRGPRWLFDVFTPPEIFFDPRTKNFTVTPPRPDSELAEAPPPFGLELVGVKREPFRLQLIGFVGGPGNYRGTFENVLSGETFLGAAGRPIPSLNLVIDSLDVRRTEIPIPDSMPARVLTATAIVRDTKTGARSTLTSRERHFTGALLALLALDEAPAAPRELRQGATLKTASALYRVEKITLAPASVEVSKETPPDPVPDRRLLPLRLAEPTDPATKTPAPETSPQ